MVTSQLLKSYFTWLYIPTFIVEALAGQERPLCFSVVLGIAVINALPWQIPFSSFRILCALKYVDVRAVRVFNNFVGNVLSILFCSCFSLGNLLRKPSLQKNM